MVAVVELAKKAVESGLAVDLGDGNIRATIGNWFYFGGNYGKEVNVSNPALWVDYDYASIVNDDLTIIIHS